MRRARILQVGTLVLLLALAAFSLAACGDDEETTTTTTEAVTTSSELETTTSQTTATTTAGITGPFVIQLTGQEEVPPVQTDATGTFTIEFGAGAAGGATTGTTSATGTTSDDDTDDGTTTTAAGAGSSGGLSGALGSVSLQWTLEVQGITDATAAHIHLGAKGENGDVLIPLYTGEVKAGEFSGTLAEGTLSLADIPAVQGMTPEQILMAIQSGGTYVNVHTTQNPAGEIRGQIEFTPGGGSTTTTSVGMGTTGTSDDDDSDDDTTTTS